jgi:hypothetical protein
VVAFGQRNHVEPFIEQKVDVTPREEIRHGVTLPIKQYISDRSFYERSLIMCRRSADVKRV